MSKLYKTRTALKKSGIGVLGGLVVVLGLILVPYPGPGWLIVFAGLAILATEFDQAQRILDFAKGKYDDWQGWLSEQSRFVKVTFWILTCIVVVATIWLLNGYGFMNDILRLNWDWVRSPLPWFY